VVPLDRIVRIQVCDLCGKQIMEEAMDPRVSLADLRFIPKVSKVVLIPPEGKPTSFTLCQTCCEAYERLVTDFFTEVKKVI
jgi:hypothetical protein